MKNLVFDVNVILDLWLKRVSHEQQLIVKGLMADANVDTYQCWISSSSLPVLEHIYSREQIKSGLSASKVVQATRELLDELLVNVRLLSNYSFHQTDALQISNGNIEDAQLVMAALSLQGETAIVTDEQRFQISGKLRQLSPLEANSWLQTTGDDQAIDFIDLKTQQDILRPQLERNIFKVIHHGQYIMGPEISELEEKLANYVGSKHCITNSSGTDALLIAMMALDIGAGDEIITTPFTFIATGEMIALLGAKAVFVDIDPETYNIDPNKIESAITSRTKAIMPVSLYGQCADFNAINAIAAKYKLPVIEDGAQSFGATYYGKQSCSLSTIGCTSFFPSKPLGGYGDSGACFTDDDGLAKAMREIRVHGQDRRYHHPRIGINGRMDTLQAAILLAKLEVFPEEVRSRAAIGHYYSELINQKNAERESEAKSGGHSIKPPFIARHNTSVYAQYTVLVNDRETIQKKLTGMGIPTAVHYPVPLNRQPALATSEYDLSIAEALSAKVMSLPMHPYLDRDTRQKIINALFSAT